MSLLPRVVAALLVSLASVACADNAQAPPNTPAADAPAWVAQEMVKQNAASEPVLLGTASASARDDGPSACAVEGVRHRSTRCREEAIAAHAGRLLGCPPDRIVLRAVMLGRQHNPTDTIFADGCGQRAVYIERPWSSPPEYFLVSRFSTGEASPSP